MKDPRPDRIRNAEDTILELHAKIERLRAALQYGRDCVMESFQYVKNNDDQILADARLQAIDAALGFQQQGDDSK